MKIIKTVSIISIITVATTQLSHGVQMSPQIRRLMTEKEEKMKALEQCDGKRKGWMIAGISTIGLTAVGVGVNIAQASKSNKLSNEIDTARNELQAQEAKLSDINSKISQKERENAEKERKQREGEIRYLASPTTESKGNDDIVCGKVQDDSETELAFVEGVCGNSKIYSNGNSSGEIEEYTGFWGEFCINAKGLSDDTQCTFSFARDIYKDQVVSLGSIRQTGIVTFPIVLVSGASGSVVAEQPELLITASQQEQGPGTNTKALVSTGASCPTSCDKLFSIQNGEMNFASMPDASCANACQSYKQSLCEQLYLNKPCTTNKNEVGKYTKTYAAPEPTKACHSFCEVPKTVSTDLASATVIVDGYDWDLIRYAVSPMNPYNMTQGEFCAYFDSSTVYRQDINKNAPNVDTLLQRGAGARYWCKELNGKWNYRIDQDGDSFWQCTIDYDACKPGNKKQSKKTVQNATAGWVTQNEKDCLASGGDRWTSTMCKCSQSKHLTQTADKEKCECVTGFWRQNESDECQPMSNVTLDDGNNRDLNRIAGLVGNEKSVSGTTTKPAQSKTVTPTQTKELSETDQKKERCIQSGGRRWRSFIGDCDCRDEDNLKRSADGETCECIGDNYERSPDGKSCTPKPLGF